MPKAPKSKVGQDKKVIHPNSRKASALARNVFREQRVEKAKNATSLKLELLAEKLLWFHSNMDREKKTYTKSELADLCVKYMDRFSEELERIKIVRDVGNRQGQQHVSREAAIKITQDKELKEFEDVGLQVPDLINGKNVLYFKEWDGQIRYIPNIKLRKMTKKDVKEQSEHGGDDSDSQEDDDDNMEDS